MTSGWREYLNSPLLVPRWHSGDTVHTASRMESTGMKGRIQCSEATRQLLVQSGKAHWLSIREDSIEAKGKGALRTYWVTPVSAHSRGAPWPSVYATIWPMAWSASSECRRAVPHAPG